MRTTNTTNAPLRRYQAQTQRRRSVFAPDTLSVKRLPLWTEAFRLDKWTHVHYATESGYLST